MSEKSMNDLLKSMIRTFVPVVVGLILSALAQIGVKVDPGTIAGAVDAIFIGGYYAIVRFLESKSPKLGWLLGLPSEPHYEVWTAQGGHPATEDNDTTDDST